MMTLDEYKPDYRILNRNNYIDLQTEVNRYLKMGYRLSGGVVIDRKGERYMQAVYNRYSS